MCLIRNYPEDQERLETEMQDMNAKEWQMDCLKFNPEYCSWGNEEDSMSGNQYKHSWSNPVEINSVSELWELDELNEVVNFYFFLHRESEPCNSCSQSGYNTETEKLYKSFHGGWEKSLTEDERQALITAGRIKPDITLDQLNLGKFNSPIGHDAINRLIMVETRAKRLGVWGKCSHCNGNGHIYVETEAKLGLQLWVIHPRKGASKGLKLNQIKQEELPTVFNYLKQARDRNYNRFSKIPGGNYVSL